MYDWIYYLKDVILTNFAVGEEKKAYVQMHYYPLLRGFIHFIYGITNWW